MHNSIRGFILFFLTQLISGCMPAALPVDNSSKESVMLSLRMEELIFVENRSDTLTRAINLPAISSREREWKVIPGLSNSLRDELFLIIKKSGKSDGLPCRAILYLDKGFYKIAGNASQVTEYAEVELSLSFELLETGKILKSSASSCNELTGVYNAKEAHVKEMYRITARNSVHKALLITKDELENLIK